jgi:hypothetical protein
MTKKLTSVTWYTLKPRELSTDTPNIKTGAMLSFGRKLRAWRRDTITYQKNGSWTGYTDSFPSDTLALYMGEYTHDGKSFDLIPDLFLIINGKPYVLPQEKANYMKLVSGGVHM